MSLDSSGAAGQGTPLRKKLLLAMLIPGLLLIMVGAIGVYSLLDLEQASGRILDNNYQTIQEARLLERSLRKLAAPGLSKAAAQAHAERFEAALAHCEDNITESGETTLLTRIRDTWRQMRPALLERSGVIPIDTLESIHAQIDELIRVNEQAMSAYEAETRRVARVMLGAVLGTALAAMLALALFALISARRISEPVREVANRLQLALKLSEDEAAPASRRGDEIAWLRLELDALLDRLARYEDEQNRRLSHLQGRLAFVMNEVLEGLVLLDAEQRILTTNRIARLILEADGGEGQALQNLALGDGVAEVLEPLLAGDFLPEHDLGELHHVVDGQERIYRPRVVTVTAASEHAVEGYLLIFWDVTEQRRFEEARRSFIAMLSHQLKTPMTSLSMSIHLLRERLDGLEPATEELLTIATESCSGLGKLISDLIEAARGTTASLSVSSKRLDLVRLLRSALRPLVPQAEEQGVTLSLPESRDEAPVMAWVDPVKFPWVVTNITGNALRYTADGGHVTVRVESGTEGELAIVVEDDGSGMEPSALSRIFQPYVSLDDEPSSGTHGLGLAIAREIVEAHGGRICVESQPGAGTRFSIALTV